MLAVLTSTTSWSPSLRPQPPSHALRCAAHHPRACAVEQAEVEQAERRAALKRELIRNAAGCNRGFGATRADRERLASLFDELEGLAPTSSPTAGIVGGADPAGVGLEAPPLAGCWRLVYTTATDVLSLDASPVAGVGAIYQLIEAPDAVTNIIDLYPRAEALLPVGKMSSKLRLRVMTRAAARSASRVGLTFYAVRAEPRALLGVDVSSLLPALGSALPRLPGAIGTDPATDRSPSFFDVVYVDDELLLIRQNSPGGVFAAVRVDASELDSSPV